MKKRIKNSKKGFTLVETLLATFILVVISTMMINGFLSTMGYSYQTSVYGKSAAKNYTDAMLDLTTWYNYRPQNYGDPDTRELMSDDTAYSSNEKTLKFLNTGTTNVEELRVFVQKRDNLGVAVPSDVSSYDFLPTNEALVDNRTAFLYCPEYCGTGDNKGKIIVMADYSGSTVKYYWVVDPGTQYFSGDPDKVSEVAIGS